MTPNPEISKNKTGPTDILPWVISQLREKHAEAEYLAIERDPQQKYAFDEFNCFAFNHVLFLADRCEALMKAIKSTEGEQ